MLALRPGAFADGSGPARRSLLCGVKGSFEEHMEGAEEELEVCGDPSRRARVLCRPPAFFQPDGWREAAGDQLPGNHVQLHWQNVIAHQFA